MKNIVILLVDDYETHFQLIPDELFYSWRVAKVYTARNIEEMKQQLSDHPEINLVITDWRMGLFTGKDVITYIKEAKPGMKVIVYSVHEYVADLAKMAGADGFLDKNNIRDNIEEVLTKILGS